MRDFPVCRSGTQGDLCIFRRDAYRHRGLRLLLAVQTAGSEHGEETIRMQFVESAGIDVYKPGAMRPRF
jgi:hypothetical protein